MTFFLGMNDVVWDEKSHSFVDVKAKDVRPVWEADESVVACTSCFTEFTMFRRRVDIYDH